MRNRKLLLFLLVFLFFFATRTIEHYNLRTNYFDEYFHDNPLWNTAHGRPLLQTIDQATFFSGHFSPILLAFSLPYLITPSPLWMFAIQAAFLAGIFLLIFSFAEKNLAPPNARLVLFLLIVNVTIRYMGINDFHMDVVLSFLLTLAMYLLFTSNRVLLPSLVLLSGFLVKEVAGAIVAGFGIYLLLFRKEKAAGLFLIVAGFIGSVILVKYVVPFFNPLGQYSFSGYYSHFGSEPFQQISNMALHPIRTLSFIFSPANILYLFLLLAPLAFLPLYRWPVLTIGLFQLLQNLLSNYRFQKDLTVQYSFVLVPVLFFALVLALKQLEEENRWERIQRWARPTIIFFASISILAFFVLQARLYLPSAKVFSAHQAFRLIPPHAAVSATDNLLVHLQYREGLERFPDIKNAEYVIFEELEPWLPSRESEIRPDFNYLFLGSVNTSPLTREQYAKITARIKTDSAFHIFFSQNGITLLRRR